MQAPALTAGQVADFLLLVCALEVKATDVGTALHFEAAHGENVGPARHVFPHRFVVFQRLT